jgi:uncharacterized protein YecT (DUF1311 family)
MSRHFFPRLFAFTLAFFPVVAFTQSSNPCDTLNGTIEVNACAQQTFETKDKELNRVYQTVLQQLDTFADNGPATRKLLILAQRKWVEFRNADCAAGERLYQGGSAAAAIYLDCMVHHTEQRIKELQPTAWQAG